MSAPNPSARPSLPRRAAWLAAVLASCWSPSGNKTSADEQVYDILAKTSAQVTGEAKTFPLERPVDTLRKRLLSAHQPVTLNLVQALDVAAENSREFQRQKEAMYLAALNLTRSINDFSVIFGGGGSAELEGVDDDSANARLSDDLSASARGAAGTRVVTSFVNTFLRSVVNGGSFDGSSILNLTLTQPLLRGAGRRIAREPLTQAERDVVYAVRSFERFRRDFAIRVATDYWSVVRQMADLGAVEANYRSLTQSREQIEEFFNAGRRTVTDLGRAKQSEYSSDSQRVAALNRLQTALDRFKFTLGLPVTAQVQLDPGELDRLRNQEVAPPEIDEGEALQLALARRFDFQTIVDQVEDAGRRVLVAEDALGITLDFSAAMTVPTEPGASMGLDWSKVGWSAGFDLDLALNNIPERNNYRTALINFELSLRNREQNEDTLAQNVRSALRDIQTAIDTYRIQQVAVTLAEQRVDATTELYAAGRVAALEKLDAQNALLQAQLSRNAALVEYAVARLELLNNLEAIAIEPKGLRFDPALPLPQPKTAE